MFLIKLSASLLRSSQIPEETTSVFNYVGCVMSDNVLCVKPECPDKFVQTGWKQHYLLCWVSANLSVTEPRFIVQP